MTQVRQAGQDASTDIVDPSSQVWNELDLRGRRQWLFWNDFSCFEAGVEKTTTFLLGQIWAGRVLVHTRGSPWRCGGVFLRSSNSRKGGLGRPRCCQKLERCSKVSGRGINKAMPAHLYHPLRGWRRYRPDS